MRVEVGKATTKAKFTGPGGYTPSNEVDSDGKPKGGSWNVANEAPLTYFYLVVDGKALGGVYFDEGTAQDDARILQSVGSEARQNATGDDIARGGVLSPEVSGYVLPDGRIAVPLTGEELKELPKEDG